jgi:archaeoflavoprotein AfpA
LNPKIAWGITGSGDYMPEIIRLMKEITQQNEDLKLYVFLSKAAQQVVKWYNLSGQLGSISNRIFNEIDSNRTEPFYYLPGALQLGKFKLFLVCPATANTVAKIVNGIADTLITNAVAQASKANVPIYVFPVDNKEGKLTTILPDSSELNLTMRRVDLENTKRLSAIEGLRVFTDISMLRSVITQ